MATSRKDYEFTARTLRAAQLAGIIDQRALRILTDTFADYFANDNPRFDRERFLLAAGTIDKRERE